MFHWMFLIIQKGLTKNTLTCLKHYITRQPCAWTFLPFKARQHLLSHAPKCHCLSNCLASLNADKQLLYNINKHGDRLRVRKSKTYSNSDGKPNSTTSDKPHLKFYSSQLRVTEPTSLTPRPTLTSCGCHNIHTHTWLYTQ